MLVEGGVTVKLWPYPITLELPFLYHAQFAPLPSCPPCTVNVVEFPKHKLLALAIIPVEEIDPSLVKTVISLHSEAPHVPITLA